MLFDILSVFQHDEGTNCGDLGSNGGKGRYLMFPHATDEVRENNDKFSPCSIKHISKILRVKKDICFVGRRACILSGVGGGATDLQCALVTVHIYTCLLPALCWPLSQWPAHLWKPDCRGRRGMWWRSQRHRPLLLQRKRACRSPVYPEAW